MSREIALLSATALIDRYKRKRLSPVEATKAALARIAALNPRFNAFCLVDEEGALAAARESEARWHKGEPLGLVDGVPCTVKDLVLTRGWPTLRGSKTVARDQPWDEDAPAVAALRRHGAVLLGKTTTPEFGWKGVTDSPLTGITRNPWNDACTPGGSSGGAAVAAALGMGALHIGTDGGGSIRIPASFSGIFGFKQSFGRVPAYPPSPFASLAHLGPMTRTVEDAALMLNVLAEPDLRDWYALPPDGRNWRAGLRRGVEGLKIAFARTLDGAEVRPEVAGPVGEAARLFQELGAEVEEVEAPLHGAAETFTKHWFAGAAALLRTVPADKHELIDPGLRRVAAEGERIALLDYLQAVKQREALGLAMNRFHARWDLLVLPTMPLPAFEAGRDLPARSDGSVWSDWSPFTYPLNLTRQPAASVPCGFTPDGLPVGLQIVGPLYRDEMVLRAARAFEAARPFRLPSL
ncbi:MAG: amidase [Rhodospirillaceae bacterium]|nr:amidase [Rhodospirillaceae bacterium]